MIRTEAFFKVSKRLEPIFSPSVHSFSVRERWLNKRSQLPNALSVFIESYCSPPLNSRAIVTSPPKVEMVQRYRLDPPIKRLHFSHENITFQQKHQIDFIKFFVLAQCRKIVVKAEVLTSYEYEIANDKYGGHRQSVTSYPPFQLL